MRKRHTVRLSEEERARLRFFITAVQIPKGVVVGQFQTEGSQEYFAMAFETGSPLVECVNRALQEMRDDGTLDAIEQEWLADKTDAPVLS